MAAGNTSSTLQVQAQSSVSDLRIDMSNVLQGAHVDAVKSKTLCVHHTDATNSIRLLQDKFYLTDNAVM